MFPKKKRFLAPYGIKPVVRARAAFGQLPDETPRAMLAEYSDSIFHAFRISDDSKFRMLSNKQYLQSELNKILLAAGLSNTP